MERKQQTSNIKFVGTGTAIDGNGKKWKLENQKKYLNYQKELLDQIHQKRQLNECNTPKNNNKKPNVRFNLNPQPNTHSNKIKDNYFEDLPNMIKSKVQNGLNDLVGDLKIDLQKRNNYIEKETDKMKDLALLLISERKKNQDEINDLRGRIADTYHKNLLHKENVLGLFSQHCCRGIFGNYYLSDYGCNNNCHLNSHRNCHNVSKFCYCDPDKYNHEMDKINCLFRYKDRSDHLGFINHIELSNSINKRCYSLDRKPREESLGLESIFSERKKKPKPKKKIKDLMRINTNEPLLKKIYARKYQIGPATVLMKSHNINPNEILELTNKGDSETLLQNNNLYLNYLISDNMGSILNETKYIGDTKHIYK